MKPKDRAGLSGIAAAGTVIAAGSVIIPALEHLVDRCDQPQLTACPQERPKSADNAEKAVRTSPAGTISAAIAGGGGSVSITPPTGHVRFNLGPSPLGGLPNYSR